MVHVNTLSRCTDSSACNYDPNADENDGSCEYCTCESSIDEIYLSTELVSTNEGNSTYRLYVNTPNSDYFISSVSGDIDNPAYLRTTTSFTKHH